MNHSSLPLLLTVAVSAFVGCKMKQTAGSRDSGQSKLMDESFAAQNKCNPDDHDRPFIIEWDATDMSSFESLAASDIVFVKYEGCSLKIMDECKNDSVRGEQGAYKPPEWTSGSLETLEIKNEGELYAKLPLGQATLGARVSGGESFHMEYFVAGTRFASRDAVYEKDLDGRYGCDEVTHFVYNYNLGAFALGSANELNVEAGGSAFGFGAGGKRTSSSKAEKKGGDLAACQAESATEVAECKAPIRLTLRKIRPGESPEAEAMAAPDTAESASAAAMINQKLEMSDEARAHYDAAVQKMNARDGKGCVKELTIHDKLNPKQKSSDSNSYTAIIRSQCVMLSGQCKAGKVQMRKAYEKMGQVKQYGAEHVDRIVEAMVGQWCEGKLSDRDTLIRAFAELNKGAYMSKQSVAFCEKNAKIAAKLVPKVKPKDEYDGQIKDSEIRLWGTVPACLARAGDCKKAFAAYKRYMPKKTVEAYSSMDPKMREEQHRNGFSNPSCKGKF